MNPKLVFFLLVAATFPEISFAHTSDASGFLSGFLHPILGFDHLAAMVAVGILGAIIGGKAVWLLPIYFPLVMSIGGVLGIKGLELPYAEYLIAISVVVLGCLIAFFQRINFVAASGIVAFFALFHGYAHGVELPEATSPVQYCVGFVFGTGMLHLCGIALSFIRSSVQGQKAIRAVGMIICLIGFYFLFK
jgi:urease accessory protein